MILFFLIRLKKLELVHDDVTKLVEENALILSQLITRI